MLEQKGKYLKLHHSHAFLRECMVLPNYIHYLLLLINNIMKLETNLPSLHSPDIFLAKSVMETPKYNECVYKPCNKTWLISSYYIFPIPI